MAKGKASKAAAKSKSGTTRVKPAGKPKPTLVKSPPAAKSAAPVARPASAPAAAATSAPGAMTSGLKKKNVKRGAPPMLPRRMVRRDLPPIAPGSPPPVPRLVAQPGSLHAPVRTPEGAESLKQRLGTVMGLINQLRGLKRTLNRQFFEAGLVLLKLSEPALYQAKGYGSFDRFVEREIEKELAIGRQTAQELLQIVKLFQREAAEQLGLEKLRGALKVLYPEPGPQSASQGPGASG